MLVLPSILVLVKFSKSAFESRLACFFGPIVLPKTVCYVPVAPIVGYVVVAEPSISGMLRVVIPLEDSFGVAPVAPFGSYRCWAPMAMSTESVAEMSAKARRPRMLSNLLSTGASGTGAWACVFAIAVLFGCIF